MRNLQKLALIFFCGLCFACFTFVLWRMYLESQEFALKKQQQQAAMDALKNFKIPFIPGQYTGVQDYNRVPANGYPKEMIQAPGDSLPPDKLPMPGNVVEQNAPYQQQRSP